jgi:hypothetical protein
MMQKILRMEVRDISMEGDRWPGNMPYRERLNRSTRDTQTFAHRFEETDIHRVFPNPQTRKKESVRSASGREMTIRI